MKKAVVIAIAALLCVSFIFSGCAGTYGKSPDQYKKIRWITPDYSFRIYPDEGCKGTYKFNEKKYNIKAEFDGTFVTVKDTDKKNKELFSGDWTYDDGKLFIYNITFNTKDYKEFKTNYAEHVALQKEKL